MLKKPDSVRAELESIREEPQARNPEPRSLDPQARSLDPQARSLDPQARSLDAEPLALHSKPHSLYPESRSLNPERRSLSAKPRLVDAELRSLKAVPRLLDPKLRSLDAEPRSLNPERRSLNAKPHARNPAPQTLHPNLRSLGTEPDSIHAEPQTLNSEEDGFHDSDLSRKETSRAPALGLSMALGRLWIERAALVLVALAGRSGANAPVRDSFPSDLFQGSGGGEDAPMMVVFEVHVLPGSDPSRILSAEAQRETQAQVMTYDEARKVGFNGLPAAPPVDHEVRLIAVAKRDASWIQRSLEANEVVGQFRVFDVD